MYSVIDKLPPVHDKYTRSLIERGVATEAELQELQAKIDAIFEDEFAQSRDYEPDKRDWLESRWKGFFAPFQRSEARATGKNICLSFVRSIGFVSFFSFFLSFFLSFM